MRYKKLTSKDILRKGDQWFVGGWTGGEGEPVMKYKDFSYRRLETKEQGMPPARPKSKPQ